MPDELNEEPLRQWALDRSQKRGNVLMRVIPANDAIGVALEAPNGGSLSQWAPGCLRGRGNVLVRVVPASDSIGVVVETLNEKSLRQ
jgi:hypothetical protein